MSAHDHPRQTSDRGRGAALTLAALVLFHWASAARAADLGAILADVTAKFALPGAILLVSGPEGRETAVTGLANLATGAPVTEQTRFHVASVGKILTAAAILQVVDEGKLGLADPVLKYVDPRDADRITHLDKANLASLLSHTSGLPDCLRNALFSIPEHPSISWTAAEALRLGRCRPATPPGKYAYSNTNYILLGHILEQVEGEGLAAILARRILAPLEMADSTAEVAPADPRLAHGYRLATPQGERRDASLLAWSSRLGDAPVTTTAADLDRLFKALFRPDSKLLSPAMLSAMKTEWGKDEDESYGYGLVQIASDFGPRFGHSGRFAGFCAEAWHYPDKDTTVIMLANGDEHTADDVMDLIEERLFPPVVAAK
ncbi:serine hydrolase domain-containing protein [Paramagnetospirillum kuznetsovii]|nr:serine hydrolase domain-containing protein [Paramagnetospirillum kuznetsovii]